MRPGCTFATSDGSPHSRSRPRTSIRIISISPISCNIQHPPVILSSHPTLGESDAWDRRPTLLSRTTNLELLPLFAPGTVVGSTLISFEIPLSWHTFRTGVWDQICTNAENTCRNLRGDPQRHRLFGRLTRFLELFKKRHSEVRDKAERSRRYARMPRGRLSFSIDRFPRPDDFTSLLGVRGSCCTFPSQVRTWFTLRMKFARDLLRSLESRQGTNIKPKKRYHTTAQLALFPAHGVRK